MFTFICVCVCVRTCSNNQQRNNIRIITICNTKTRKSIYSRPNWSKLSGKYKFFAKPWSKCWRQKEEEEGVEALMILKLEKGKQIEYWSKYMHNMHLHENRLVLSWQDQQQQQKETTNACCFKQATTQITVTPQVHHRLCLAITVSCMTMMYCLFHQKIRIIATRAITN